MRKRLLNLLLCPNSKKSLRVQAIRLRRGGSVLKYVGESEIEDTDEIVDGILVSDPGGYAYPIVDGIPVLLSDRDVNKKQHVEILSKMAGTCRGEFSENVKMTIGRLQNSLADDSELWNIEEMEFFDRAVETERDRRIFLGRIKKEQLWNIFLVREKYLFRRIGLRRIAHGDLLEVGCGNSRTAYWLFRPSSYGYRYVGTDISYKRLLLAQSVLPEGDFIQCSAANLPFKKEAFAAVIGLGVFHHLSDPIEGINECADKVAAGGFLAFHEPISRSGLLSDNNLIKRRLQVYEHSQHDSTINDRVVMLELEKLRFKIISKKYDNSLFRTLAQAIVERLKLNTKKWIIGCIAAADEIVLHTVCRISKKLGPTALTVVARRPGDR